MTTARLIATSVSAGLVITATVSIPGFPEPATFIVQEPVFASLRSSTGSTLLTAPSNSSDGSTVSREGQVSALEVPTDWQQTFDTVGMSLRVKTVRDGLPSELAVIRVAAQDTAVVVSRRSIRVGETVRSDYFVIRVPGSQRIDIDLTGVLAKLDVVPLSVPASTQSGVSFGVYAFAKSCARAAYTLFAPAAVHAQSPNCADQISGLADAAEDRGWSRAASALGTGGGLVAIGTGGPVGWIAGGIAIAGSGIVYVAGETIYNRAADKLWYCQNPGGGAPPRCSRPTMGRCNPRPVQIVDLIHSRC
jgi:hypothetical protein